MYQHSVPSARHTSHAGRGSRSHAGRHDVGSHVLPHVHLQQQQYDLYDGHLDAVEKETERSGNDDREQVGIRPTLKNFEVVFFLRRRRTSLTVYIGTILVADHDGSPSSIVILMDLFVCGSSFTSFLIVALSEAELIYCTSSTECAMPLKWRRASTGLDFFFLGLVSRCRQVLFFD